jgi:hypothetical protein
VLRACWLCGGVGRVVEGGGEEGWMEKILEYKL